MQIGFPAFSAGRFEKYTLHNLASKKCQHLTLQGQPLTVLHWFSKISILCAYQHIRLHRNISSHEQHCNIMFALTHLLCAFGNTNSICQNICGCHKHWRTKLSNQLNQHGVMRILALMCCTRAAFMKATRKRATLWQLK